MGPHNYKPKAWVKLGLKCTLVKTGHQHFPWFQVHWQKTSQRQPQKQQQSKISSWDKWLLTQGSPQLTF